MNIRPFRYSDLAALIQIADVSFADEYTSRGETPESFAKQIRGVARGRMIPFRLVTALAGYKWEMFVAEVDGRVVGCGGYVGSKEMELSNLMVHPQYRRRGIGQALLEKRLQRLAEGGYPFVTTTILASNQASLGNVTKQGFVVFDRYTILEARLPLLRHSNISEGTVVARLIQPSDKEAFKHLERRISSPLWLQYQGSAAPSYFLSFGERMMNRFSNTLQWAQAFSRNDVIVGFLAAITSRSQTAGVLPRPVIADENLHLLPAMLYEAANWLEQQGKITIQVAVPDERIAILDQLESTGWTKTQSWVRLVKLFT